MATEQQLQQVINLLQQQMTTVVTLQEENAALREGQTANNDGNPHNRNKSKKPDRPIINAGIDDREWALFMDTWARYKSMIGVNNTDVATVRQELRTACSSEVNKLLFEFVGAATLNACTEDELLGHIKSVAVKTVHKEVHRMAFNNMAMNQGETVTTYVARLKAKAFLCQFEVRCTSCDPPVSISYAEEMVSQRLIAGHNNPDHQRKILSEAATLTTLAEKVKRLQILETTEESATVLHTPAVSSESAASSYQREKKTKGGGKKPPVTTTPGEAKLCGWCGKATHPEGKPMDHVNCPAYGKECWTCHKKGHLHTVCKSSRAASGTDQPQEETDTPFVPVPSESAVSFSFAAQPDFRRTKKRTGNR